MRNHRMTMTGEMSDVIRARAERNRQQKQRRTRQLRRRLTIAGFTMSAMLGVLIFAFAGSRSAASEEETIYKYYRSVVILPRDTVETLAADKLTDEERTGISDTAAYVHEIRRINHLSDEEQPLAGTTLVIPYYSYEYLE